MAFQKMKKPQYPPRLWVLVSFPGDGKTTFSVQMRGPILPIDADHRYTEALDSNPGQEVLSLCESPVDQINPHAIAKHLATNMPGSNVGTIVVDSLTAIISPRVVKAMVGKDTGDEKNLSAAFRDKALAMREIQDAVTGWGTDVLWIWHMDTSRNAKGTEDIIHETLSKAESRRLTRSINMRLEIVREGDKRGVKIAWCRRGRSGVTPWDDTGNWAGMPERIEAAAYDIDLRTIWTEFIKTNAVEELHVRQALGTLKVSEWLAAESDKPRTIEDAMALVLDAMKPA